MPKEHARAEMNNLGKLIKFISTEIEEIPFNKNERNKIELACEEVLVNIITHAYDDTPGEIQLDLYHLPENTGCRITIRDTAPEFNPLEQTPPNTNLPPESRDTGGLGIYLIRENMDKVSYVRDGDENRLTMTKWVNGGIPAGEL